MAEDTPSNAANASSESVSSSGTEKTLVLIDDSNLFYGFNKAGWRLDYQKFYDWLHRNFSILDIYFFGGIISKKTFFDRHPDHTLSGYIQQKKQTEGFFKLLKRIGYKVSSKPVASVYDDTEGEFKRKCNFDVEITIIALDRLKDYKELILCSGDGDFLKLIKYLKGKGKKTTLLAHKDRINWSVKEAANRVIFFRQIKEEVQKA